MFDHFRLAGADVYVCYDRTLHKFWVVVINSVYRSDLVSKYFLHFEYFLHLKYFQQAEYEPNKLWN